MTFKEIYRNISFLLYSINSNSNRGYITKYRLLELFCQDQQDNKKDDRDLHLIFHLDLLFIRQGTALIEGVDLPSQSSSSQKLTGLDDPGPVLSQ